MRQDNGLLNDIFVFGSKLLLTKSLKQAAKLFKRSVDFVKELIYIEIESSSNNPPMPLLVNFVDTYIDENFPQMNYQNSSRYQSSLLQISGTLMIQMYMKNIFALRLH